MKKNLTLPQIYFGTFLALIILLVVIVLGYQSLGETQKSSVWVNHTLSVISKIQKLQSNVNALGVSQRGYIITSQERYLNDFESSLILLDKEITLLERMTKKTQQERMIELKSLIQKLIKHYKVNIDHIKSKDVIFAVDRVKRGTGQNYLDAIEKILAQMTRHEELRLQGRLKNQKEISDQSSSLILFGSTTAFLLVLLAAITVLFEFKRRTEIQRILNKTSQLQKAILNSAAYALIASDAKGTITLFNTAAEELLGYSASEVMGKNPAIFHDPEEVARMASALEKRFNEKIPVGYETLIFRASSGILESDQWTYIKKDGEKIPVNLSVSAQRDTNGEIEGYIAIAYDISKQLEYESAIINAKEAALAGTKAKSEFLANMSHEIRTPMNAIMGMAELLNETTLDIEQKKYVGIFQRAGESLLNIINDILDLSKIEAGHFELDHIPFSLTKLIDKTSEIMALKAHQKQLEFAIDIENDLHDFYIGDPNRIRQIILNLLGNAIKFTKRGEVLLKVSQGKRLDNKKEVVIEVQDTGIGMTEEQRDKLFERFAQADSSITKEYGGTGLGLNICKHLVDHMGGRIEVLSSFGIGSRFTIHLFLEEDEIIESYKENPGLIGKRILIVDDTKTNRFIFKKILEHQGAITDEAEDGPKALERIREQARLNSPYDLVLLDYRMPGMDGFNVAKEVQSSSSLKGPVLMMITSDNRPGDLAKSKTLGLNSYLVKPVLKNELLEEIYKTIYNIQPDIALQQSELIHESTVNLNILLVDDNEENRLVIRSFLKSLPWKIDEAKDGREALIMFEQAQYDLILMDMQMPVMDGYTATEEIRKIESVYGKGPTPILALTAYALKEEIDKSYHSGCNGHLSKPVSKNNLIKCIRENTGTYNITIDKELEELIPEYLNNRAKEVLELVIAFQKEDYGLIQANGHRLRGSAGSYGFTELSEIGKELEDKAKAMDAATVNFAINQYQLYLKRLKVKYQ
jgi:two-component system, sensor histidine kinase and response regulator